MGYSNTNPYLNPDNNPVTNPNSNSIPRFPDGSTPLQCQDLCSINTAPWNAHH